jgi:ketosteroid isomerase-like protein
MTRATRNAATAALLMTFGRMLAADGTATTATTALDKELSVAFVDHTPPVVDRLLTEDFLLVTSNAKVRTKGDLMAEASSPDVVLEVNESTEVKVRVHGDTAVLTGILHQKGTVKGKAYDARVRYTDTWIRAGSTWKQLSGHASLLPFAGRS